MNVSAGTRIRILATSFLLTATALGGITTARQVKNAEGCSLDEDSRPSRGGCEGGGHGCYDCLYSDPAGIIECFESPDGDTMVCQPFAD
jgi:hypothetical protein